MAPKARSKSAARRAGSPSPAPSSGRAKSPRSPRGAATAIDLPSASASANVPSVEDGKSVAVFGAVQALARGSGIEDTELAGRTTPITMEELLEIRSLTRPPKVVQRTLEATCLILDAARSSSPKPPAEWTQLKMRINDDRFLSEVMSFDASTLRAAPAVVSYVHKRYFDTGKAAMSDAEPLTYERVRRASVAVSALFRWCMSVVETATEEAAATVEESSSQKDAEEKDRMQQEAEEKAKLAAQEAARQEAEEEARRVAEEEARLAAEEEAKRRAAEEEARRIAEDNERRDVEEARRIAQEKARRDAEEEARRVAEENAKRATEQADKAKREAGEKAKLALTELELSHFQFRRDAGLCPDQWPQDSDCVICSMFAHLSFRREAYVCPEGHDSDRDCPICVKFELLKDSLDPVF